MLKVKAQSGKLRISERVEACLHTKRAEAGSSTRSVVKAESGKVEACLHTKRAEAGSSTLSVVKAENLLTVYSFDFSVY